MKKRLTKISVFFKYIVRKGPVTFDVKTCRIEYNDDELRGKRHLSNQRWANDSLLLYMKERNVHELHPKDVVVERSYSVTSSAVPQSVKYVEQKDVKVAPLILLDARKQRI